MYFNRTDFYVLLGIFAFVTLMWSWEVSRCKVEIQPTAIPCYAIAELGKCRARLADMVERERHEIMAENPQVIEPDKEKVVK